MITTTACRKRSPFSGAAVAWSLAVVFLLAVASPPLYACDDGTAVPNPGDNPGLVADCKVLLALRDELAGTGSLNWDPQLAMTSWHGIHVTGSPGRVTVLIIARQVAGAIPAQLGQLAELERLDLSRNQLTGPIPVELGQLTGLEWLGLSGNQLTGLIPAELGQLTQLQTLSLAGNQLAGAIPAELSQLSRLEQLGLGGNQLTGSIPPELGQLTQLQLLSLADNQLTGEIPAQLGQLTQLQRLFLSDNQLTGVIPVQLGQLSALLELDLSSNQLAGVIPAELGQLSQLWHLYLQHNQLTGEVPAELGQLAQLLRLDLSSNQLTGPIPIELSQLTRLLELSLADNQLTGSIPGELGQMTQLWALHLQRNQLTGSIPAELGRFFQLHELHLYSNQLTGEIPAQLGQLTELLELHLQHNQLTGTIPEELGQLSNLREFSFRGNRLAGLIPQELRHLPDLYVLNLEASWVAPGQMKVFWDDSGDPTASYEYRLFDPVQRWTGWAEIADSETMLGADEEETIEWTLTISPAYSVDRFRIVYSAIEIRARNREGTSSEAIAIVRALEGSGITSNTDQPQVDIPYCLEHQFRLFWENTPCATVAVLPQVVMGVLGINTAQTEIILTNRDPDPDACEVALLFHQGTSEAPEVSFNDPGGRLVGHNFYLTSLPRGGAQIFTLTPTDADQLVIGAVWVFARSPCSVDSLQVQGRYLLRNRIDGEIEEIFSVSGQGPQEWLGDGDCQVLTGIFGTGRDVGFASVTSNPEQGAPLDTWLHFRSFDLEGNLIGNPPSVEISGAQSAIFPWSFEEPTIIEMCLDVPEPVSDSLADGTTDSNFYISTLAVGVMQTAISQQWTDEAFADVFPAGSPSAWSDPGP